MATPAGTLRVGRYFSALAVLFAIFYSIVAFGSTHTPKLGLDLVGGIRVVFTALTPEGSPQPTSSQMSQARQIIEDRINGTGVTGSTVVVQGNNQLVVEIPSGTKTDLATLGSASLLNFRGLVAPAQTTTCIPANLTTPGSGSPSGSTTPSGSSSSSSSSGAVSGPSGSTSSSPATSSSRSSGAASTSPSGSHAPGGFAERPLAKAPASTTAATSPASGSSSSKSASTKSASTKPGASPTGSTSAAPTASASAPAATPCLADPFTNPKAPAAVRNLKSQLVKLYGISAANPKIQDVLPNAETCPSPAIANSDCRAYSKLTPAEQSALTAGLQSLDCSSTLVEPDLPTGAYYACDGNQRTNGAAVAYLLGHVIVKGTQIDSATAEAPNTTGTGGSIYWTVALKLKPSGGNNWNAWTSKYNTGGSAATTLSPATCAAATSGSECSLFVGFTLNGAVISTPVTEAALDINTSISGNYSESQAKSLTQQLNYGKLPFSFRADDAQTVSATLGNQQLKAAFLAGGIGLALVVLYSLIYYRALGLVTVASLVVSAGLTYALLVILGKQLGYSLDLAGIAGFIVALGITADSFVVFFERLKDEVHEGRSARVAVPRAWARARRTILSADTVSFLAAAILYFFASADVKGFAFTLGMSTILDLVVVFLFTHPIVALLSRSPAFGSARFTGLDAVRGGPALDTEPAPRPRRRGAATGTAVLDQPDTAVQTESDTRVDTGTGSGAAETGADAEPAAGVTAEDTEPADESAPPPRPSGGGAGPAGGTAAERAAARRARMRQQRDNGDAGTGDAQGDES